MCGTCCASAGTRSTITRGVNRVTMPSVTSAAVTGLGYQIQLRMRRPVPPRAVGEGGTIEINTTVLQVRCCFADRLVLHTQRHTSHGLQKVF